VNEFPAVRSTWILLWENQGFVWGFLTMYFVLWFAKLLLVPLILINSNKGVSRVTLS
jgi:hypothetical protein